MKKVKGFRYWLSRDGKLTAVRKDVDGYLFECLDTQFIVYRENNPPCNYPTWNVIERETGCVIYTGDVYFTRQEAVKKVTAFLKWRGKESLYTAIKRAKLQHQGRYIEHNGEKYEIIQGAA